MFLLGKGQVILAQVRARFPHHPKEFKVKEATKDLYFPVFPLHCENGLASEPGMCPTALALEAWTRKHWMVRTSVILCVDLKKSTVTRYFANWPLSKEITKFDRMHKEFAQTGVAPSFTPGTYKLKKIGKTSSIYHERPDKTTKPGSHPHKGPMNPYRQFWSTGNERPILPVASRAALAKLRDEVL
jgi:hypothetical protein